jgi:hypothetical protein
MGNFFQGYLDVEMYKYNTLKHCTTFAVHVRFEPSSPYMKFKRLNHCHDMNQRCGICHVLIMSENPIYLQENTVLSTTWLTMTEEEYLCPAERANNPKSEHEE